MNIFIETVAIVWLIIVLVELIGSLYAIATKLYGKLGDKK